jgi:histidyl-tRNA synthetase
MKPSIPRGTRDFGPLEMRKRGFIFSRIRKNFELFGFEPLETPAMENIGTLTGKYGEEGDQLIFKVLNSRIHESKEKENLKKEFDLSLEASRNSETLTEKALKYDLTVPFARYVVMNQGQLTFPFKRYQIQPVWRADRPQKGRYREFYQCDADIIGSASLVNELDLVLLMEKSFQELGLPVLLKFNNRKILTALAEVTGVPDKLIDLTVALDKLDKIGKDGVKKELREKGIPEKTIDQIQPLLDFEGDNLEKVGVLEKLLGHSASGKQGISEIRFLLDELLKIGLHHLTVELDITLARGLNYYTGTIFEVKAKTGSLSSSILGGGRYDDLTGIFGLKGMSGVGISFGIDRIYDVMEELGLFPPEISKASGTKVLFSHFDEPTQIHCLHLAQELRKNDICCEIFPELTKKLGKQFEFANKKGIPYVCTVGSEEMEKGVYAIKNMETGIQQKLNIKDLIHYIKNN